MDYQSGQVCVFFRPTNAAGCSAIPRGVRLVFQSKEYDHPLIGWLDNYDYATERSVCLECAKPVADEDGKINPSDILEYNKCRNEVRETTAAVLTVESITLKATVSINQFVIRNLDLSNCFNSSSFASADLTEDKLCANLALSGNCTMDFIGVLFGESEKAVIEPVETLSDVSPPELSGVPVSFSYMLESLGFVFEFELDMKGIMNALYERMASRAGDAGNGGDGGGDTGDASDGASDGDSSGGGTSSGDSGSTTSFGLSPSQGAGRTSADSFRLGATLPTFPVPQSAFKTTLEVSGDGIYSFCATMDPSTPDASKVNPSIPLNDPYSTARISLGYLTDEKILSTVRAELGEVVSGSLERCFDNVRVVPYANVIQVILLSSSYAAEHPGICSFRGDDQLYKVENSLAFKDSAGKYSFHASFNSSQSISSENNIISFPCVGENNSHACANMGNEIMHGTADFSGVYMLSLKTVQWETYKVFKIPIQEFHVGCWTKTRVYLYGNKLCLEMLPVDEEYCPLFRTPAQTGFQVTAEIPSDDDYLNSLVYGRLSRVVSGFSLQTREVCFSQDDFTAAEAGSLGELISYIISLPRMRISILLTQGTSVLTAGVVSEVLNRNESKGGAAAAVVFVLVVVADLIYLCIMGKRLYTASRTLDKTIRRQRKQLKRQAAAHDEAEGGASGGGNGGAEFDVVASPAAV